MKRLVIVAVCAMAVMISCKNKGKTEAASLDDSISFTSSSSSCKSSCISSNSFCTTQCDLPMVMI